MNILDNLRIIKKGNLYFVEQKVKKNFFSYKWTPFITWSGMDNSFGFNSFDSALDATILKIKYYLIINMNN